MRMTWALPRSPRSSRFVGSNPGHLHSLEVRGCEFQTGLLQARHVSVHGEVEEDVANLLSCCFKKFGI